MGEIDESSFCLKMNSAWVMRTIIGGVDTQTQLAGNFIAGSLESANSSILASCDHFKEVVGKKIRILW